MGCLTVRFLIFPLGGVFVILLAARVRLNLLSLCPHDRCHLGVPLTAIVTDCLQSVYDCVALWGV